ncbi:MAG: lamin tail domain-containing protein [Candidatus Nanoarchaeia archaeon]|nr:lamin tail domain-containing protein [Candidatus Nanoarchaeia archaeon]MDD5587703.1 lamin tail domain-containing protein [Candidatus Nanoarchaeia archaeon]
MQKYQVFLISIFIILFSSTVLAELRINEVVYNPLGKDNYKEFVEIYSDEPINLTNWTISDGDSEDILKKLNDIDSNYALIVETDYILNIPENVALYSAGASIGNGLSEDDKVTLYDSYKKEIASMQIFKIDEGYSLEFFENNYYKSLNLNGTPGSENSIKEIPKEEPEEEIENESSEEEKVDTTNLDQESTIEITKYPEKIGFGENISIEINVYRGSTAKYAVYFYVGKDNKTLITNKISEHARIKYMNYTFNFTIPLKSNCKDKYEPGKYYIFVEGLELKENKEIEVSEDTHCKTLENTTNTPLKQELTTEQQIEEDIQTKTESNINTNPEKVTGNVIYESSDFKAKRLSIYFLCVILILLVIFLFARKNETKDQSNN